uniref:Putative pre-16S rRNA nuclease n=1 Tax=Jahnella sp. MSr9139 TaxID=1434086 RepID=A0A4Y5SZG8_9BACT|nr:Holliday junction resolvase [Jahnella sp. MSr9139]
MPVHVRVGRVAAIDLGKARVGVALSDELGVCAHPRPPLDGRNRRALLEALTALVREEGVTRFLVGVPLELDGREGPAARKALGFAQALADATRVEVELIDERLSTVEASRRLREGGVDARRQKPRVDGAAAAVLLQSWLDSRSG